MSKLRTRKISGALGAEIDGVNLDSDLDAETVKSIKTALLNHLVVFFRDQQITPEQHVSFARRFGRIEVQARGLDGNFEILPVIKEADDRNTNFGGVWHSDVSFHRKPPMGQIMIAREVPVSGGDTIFANMYLAYHFLSDAMKKVLQNMEVIHTGERSFKRGVQTKEMRVEGDADTEISHPIVRTHPETGQKSLYMSNVSMQRFAGMSYDESQPLLSFLISHVQRPEFTCRFRWRKNSIAFWDNRCTQHIALNDYFGFRRVMHRITIAGERPE